MLRKKFHNYAVIIKYFNFFQTKKGVKRKADSTTTAASTTALPPSAPYDPPYEPVLHPNTAAANAERRNSVRQIKKPKKDLPDDQAQHSSKAGKGKLSSQLKYCNQILKELFVKKHAVSAPPVCLSVCGSPSTSLCEILDILSGHLV
jgi:hypothetical protein